MSVEKQREAQRPYARMTLWLLLAVIVAYAGLQAPLPYRLVAVAAGLAGVAGGIILVVQSLRKKLSVLMLLSGVIAVLACGMFAGTAAAQALFWEATVEFDECQSSALTERSMSRCFIEYEENMLDSVPSPF